MSGLLDVYQNKAIHSWRNQKGKQILNPTKYINSEFNQLRFGNEIKLASFTNPFHASKELMVVKFLIKHKALEAINDALSRLGKMEEFYMCLPVLIIFCS